jgi:predicted secreted hydrolase
MNKLFRRWLPAIFGAIILLYLVIRLVNRNETAVQATLISPVSQLNDAGNASSPANPGFTRADGSRSLSFPGDFGPHPSFQTEWWYYTGNLQTADGRHFGFQLTFFRQALLPTDQVQSSPSDWRTDQVYMAHLALTDVAAGSHTAFQRLERGAVGLAGAIAAPYKVWLDDWNIAEVAPNTYQLNAAQEGIVLDLVMEDAKGPVLQGDQGYSQKGPDPGDASYYFSQTHLITKGSVQVDGTVYQVNGLSWMDHEFSTSALTKNQVGWDWFSIQLENDYELMVFQIRQKDGSVDPFSSGALIRPDGHTILLSRDEFRIQALSTWTSPRTGAVYPSNWRVFVPSENISLDIEPYLADQEMILSFTYWEGAVRISGSQGGKPVTGSGYVELTGYTLSR